MRLSHPIDHTARNATQLLVLIGIPRKRFVLAKRTSRAAAWQMHAIKRNKLSRYSLWNRNEWELLDLLREAREIYHKRIKSEHPDVPGGSHEKAVSLNHIWTKLLRMFKERGITLNP